MLNVIITFDYEIFFGKNNASEEDILFKPTIELMNLLEKYGLSGTFFADVLSVDAYRRSNPSNDYPLRFEAQIGEMISRGHDVQLHIHPHWITAQFKQEIGQWEIDPKTYRIHAFMDDRKYGRSADEIITSGVSYLCETLKPVDDTYECYAYRAGGYCIQPEEELFKVLAENGIEIDSSVCIGKKLYSEAHYFDFDKDYEEINWKMASGIVELPIGSVNNNLLKRLIPGTGFQTLQKEPSKGEGIAGTTRPTQVRLMRALKYNKSKKEFGLEFMHYKQLLYGLKQYYRKYNCDSEDRYVAVICHPKSMDHTSTANMETFIQKILDNKDRMRFAALKEMRSVIRKSINKS